MDFKSIFTSNFIFPCSRLQATKTIRIYVGKYWEWSDQGWLKDLKRKKSKFLRHLPWVELMALPQVVPQRCRIISMVWGSSWIVPGNPDSCCERVPEQSRLRNLHTLYFSSAHSGVSLYDNGYLACDKCTKGLVVFFFSSLPWVLKAPLSAFRKAVFRLSWKQVPMWLPDARVGLFSILIVL